MEIEISIGKGAHSIASDNILCCNETGRVIAVFYNDYDLISLQEELETLRASNRIKQANIELLEAENAKLIAERDLYKSNCVAYECNCLSCKSTFLGEKEQHICFKCLLAERVWVN